MIFPIGDEQIRGGYKPIFSYSLIAVNVLLFLYEISLQSTGLLEYFIHDYGAIPVEVLHGNYLYSVFTNTFLHAGWSHLLGNMLFLWIFADNIESSIGNFRFLIFYLLGGIIASITHILFNTNSSIPSLGASGAISAVMGCYLVMFPSSRVKVLVLIFLRSIYIPSIFFLGFWIIFQIYSGISDLNGVEGEKGGGVAYWAHIGGFAFGILYGLIARAFFVKRGQLYVES